MNLSEKDLESLKNLSTNDINSQLKMFNSSSFADLVEPATIDNGGINQFSEKKINSLAKTFDSIKNDYRLIKFIPASGAASRMFKNLFIIKNILSEEKNINESDKIFPFFKSFCEGLKSLAFYDKLLPFVKNPDKLIENKDFLPFINAILDEDKLNLSAKPKAFIDFHKYKNISRNALKEQIYEYALFGADEDNKLFIHLTISEKNEAELIAEQEILKKELMSKFGQELILTWSFQKPSTDTFSFNMDGNIVTDKNGNAFLRPGGHGALLQNLDEIDSEIVFIKNIDNITHETKIQNTILYKKALAAYLMEIVENIHGMLELLDDANISEEELNEMLLFANNKLSIKTPAYISGFEFMEKVDYLYTIFNRPVRICGMVKNEGEPGGGPFFVRDESGNISLQIVESAQIDMNNEKQSAIFKSSTHFNPVDLVCYTRDFEGDSFALNDFSDPKTCIVSTKSLNGTDIKTLELPGLWNGAMSDWITIFVEVPLSTFNPVKEVTDLLRPNHLEI